MKNKIFRLFLLLAVLFTVPAVSIAQSSDDAYNKGVTMMNNGNYNEAIKYFNVSKNLNSTAKNVSRCNSMIAKCKKQMRGKDKSSDRRREKQEKTSVAYLELFPQNMTYSSHSTESKEVSVNCDRDDWTCNVKRQEGEDSWCKAEKLATGQLKITCSASDKTIERRTSVLVWRGSLKDSVNIRQPAGARADLYIDSYQAESKDVTLSRGEVKNPVISVSKKNGIEQVVVNVVCKSDTIYQDGYNNNWTVVSMPSWCKRKSTKKIYEKKLIDKIKKKIKKESEQEEPIEGDELVFEIPKITSSKLLKSGRIDNIVLRSQDQQCVIEISQTDK